MLEAGIPSPSETLPDDSQDIDLAITAPRFDASTSGLLAAERPSGTSPGPRQRRFQFDARIIRDSLVRKLRLIDRNDIALPIDHCHSQAVFKQCTGCKVVKTFYNRCERFYCPICAARLARDRRETVSFWKDVVGQPKHVVLTVKSVSTLSNAYVRELKDDLRRLRSQKWCKEGREEPLACIVPWRRDMPWSFWRGEVPKRFFITVRDGVISRKSAAWLGGFWSIDVTWNPPRRRGEVATVGGKSFRSQEDSEGGFHVHFHSAVDSQFIDAEWLEQAWSKMRGQDFSVVDVIDVKGKDYTAEVCKYVCDGVQLGNWPAEILAQFIDALSEERCFGTFGALYKQRAEWTKFKDEMHADRQVCECGCTQWAIYDENEWEWQQAKSSLAPPHTPSKRVANWHAEMFPPVACGVK